jgi:hypothetical protein
MFAEIFAFHLRQPGTQLKIVDYFRVDFRNHSSFITAF